MMSIISFVFVAINYNFRLISPMDSFATYEQMLPCINKIMPVNVISSKMRNDQHLDVKSALENSNYEVRIHPASLYIGLKYSGIAFSNLRNFSPYFSLSTGQIKRINTFIGCAHWALCVIIFLIVLMIICYKESKLIWPVYIFIFVLGGQWLSLSVNQLPCINSLLKNNSNSANWEKIIIDHDNLYVQWMEITPFVYLYKSNCKSDDYLKDDYNFHANWQKISKGVWLCRYDSLIKLVNEIHRYALYIFLLGIIMITYVLFNSVWRITSNLFDKP